MVGGVTNPGPAHRCNLMKKYSQHILSLRPAFCLQIQNCAAASPSWQCRLHNRRLAFSPKNHHIDVNQLFLLPVKTFYIPPHIFPQSKLHSSFSVHVIVVIKRLKEIYGTDIAFRIVLQLQSSQILHQTALNSTGKLIALLSRARRKYHWIRQSAVHFYTAEMAPYL